MRFSASTLSFYPPDIDYPNPPGDLVDVDPGDYALIQLGLAQGKVLAVGAMGYPTIEDAPALPITTQRADALRTVLDRTRAIRMKYLTDLPGQDMVYLSKVAEAKAWLAAGLPDDLAAYPLIEAEIGETGADAAGVTSVWLARAAAWTAIAATLEGARLGAGGAIAAAATEADIAAALADFEAAVASL